MLIRKDKVNDELVIAIRGDITESSEEIFGKLLDSELEAKVVFELSKVQMINSIGVREWIAMMVKLKKRKTKLIYRNCSLSIIECTNMFPDFLDRPGIESFIIPTSCPECDHKMEEIVTPASVKASEFTPTKSCPTCNIQGTTAVDLEEYLNFIFEE